ncbi:IclR family transcriptional regulator [Nonomuraea sp. NPDC050153]|uniref:IclR family transcriptional regulator n=1 Tax=Nonomuraea sp. NPDC050153 TaxID=3364359 RepID=UPI00379E019E
MARTVPAVNRALDILELFLAEGALAASDITARLGLPRTTVHELVNTLVDRGYLVAEPSAPIRYQLGMKLFELGGHFADRLDLARQARHAASEVAAACDEGVHVAVLDGAEVVYIAKVDSTHPVRMVSAVGRRLPAHCTAVGKMLLSALTPEALESRYPHDRPLRPMTANSITTHAGLRAQLAEIRRTGVAYDNCESNEAVACVAVGVLDHSGRMVAAMSVSVPTLRWTDRRREQWTDLVRAGAATLSLRLGHHDGAQA